MLTIYKVLYTFQQKIVTLYLLTAEVNYSLFKLILFCPNKWFIVDIWIFLVGFFVECARKWKAMVNSFSLQYVFERMLKLMVFFSRKKSFVQFILFLNFPLPPQMCCIHLCLIETRWWQFDRFALILQRTHWQIKSTWHSPLLFFKSYL